jgi:hypothetical protein
MPVKRPVTRARGGGIVWTYIGDKKKVPPFRRFSFMDAEAANRTIIRGNIDCNYLDRY